MDSSTPLVPLLDVQRFLSEDFFTLTGLQDLTDKEQEAVVEQIKKAVLARTYLSIVKMIPLELRKDFSRLPDYEMVPFAEEHGINVGEILVEEGIRYRAEVAQLLLAASAYQVPYGRTAEVV